MIDNTNITLYTISCDRKQINKAKSWDKVVDITDTFRVKQPSSILNPVITLSVLTVGEDKYPNVNYAYVPLWGRYYFVDDITLEHDGLLTLTLSVDVLMSYRDKILSSQQFIARAESLNSALYIDNERPIQANKKISPSDSAVLGIFPESIGNNYILTVAGGYLC